MKFSKFGFVTGASKIETRRTRHTTQSVISFFFEQLSNFFGNLLVKKKKKKGASFIFTFRSYMSYASIRILVYIVNI